MGKDPRIDAYIEQALPFAQPILRYLRNIVHKACPDVEETMKWSFPHFDYKGVMCGMAAFKEHCSFGFWKAALMKEAQLNEAEEGMGHFGKIKDIADLPSEKILMACVKEAVKLNEEGISLPKKPRKEKQELVVPSYFLEALKKNKKALTTFENFPPSQKKEYVEWITEAKQEGTRNKRLDTAIEWLSEGKRRHWKYENC